LHADDVVVGAGRQRTSAGFETLRERFEILTPNMHADDAGPEDQDRDAHGTP
jgi:hypothetical protein